MHSTSTDTIHFNHNGDFSGAIIFRVPWPAPEGVEYPEHFAAPFSVLARAAAEAGDAPDVDVEVRGLGPSYQQRYTDQRYTLTLPTADLRTLVGGRVLDERISALENMDGSELFDLGRADEVAKWASETPDWS